MSTPTEPVTVRLKKAWLDQHSYKSPVHEGCLILKRLKEEGIPIRGVLGPVVPETGSLTIELDDLAGDDRFAEYVYTWRP